MVCSRLWFREYLSIKTDLKPIGRLFFFWSAFPLFQWWQRLAGSWLTFIIYGRWRLRWWLFTRLRKFVWEKSSIGMSTRCIFWPPYLEWIWNWLRPYSCQFILFFVCIWLSQKKFHFCHSHGSDSGRQSFLYSSMSGKWCPGSIRNCGQFSRICNLRIRSEVNSLGNLSYVHHRSEFYYADGNGHGWTFFLAKIQSLAAQNHWDHPICYLLDDQLGSNSCFKSKIRLPVFGNNGKIDPWLGYLIRNYRRAAELLSLSGPRVYVYICVIIDCNDSYFV